MHVIHCHFGSSSKLESRGAYLEMHSVRCASVESNRDVSLLDLMQRVGASAEDLEWCTQNGLETASDLQYIGAAHIPKGGVLESLWNELQGRPSGMVVSIVQERQHTQHAAAEKSMQKRVKQRLWLPSKRQRKSIEPTTISRDEQLRLDAAAVVVDLSWSWAPLQHGLGHDVLEFMAARRKAAQAKALGTAFEANSMHGAVKVWRQLETWFQEQHVAMPGQM